MEETRHDANVASMNRGERPSDGGEKNQVSQQRALDNDNSNDDDVKSESKPTPSIWKRTTAVIFWVPPNCRWNPEEPPKFSMALNILFAFAGAFTVANLYYNHPILNILAKDFDVPYEKVAEIPTLAQAGYAVGLFFLCPLGDLLKRRPFVLSLVLFTATMRYACRAVERRNMILVLTARKYRNPCHFVTCSVLRNPIHHRCHHSHSAAHATARR